MSELKDRLHGILGQAKHGVEKTTKIGVKLFQSGQLSAELHDRLQKLGEMFYECASRNKNDLSSFHEQEKCQNLINEITEIHKKISEAEEEIQSIKKT